MRPTLNVISPELCAKVVTEAKRILAETGIDIRGASMRQRLLDHGLKTTRRRHARAVPAGGRRSRDRHRAEVVHALQPRRPAARRARRQQRALRAGLERPEDPRSPHRRDPPVELDRLHRIRAALRRPRAHRLPGHGVLDQQGHRVAGVGRLAPVHAAHDVEEADGLRRVHRARRAAHARHDAAVPPRPRRADREADVDLHDHRDRQLPLRRGLLPEHARLRRGRHPGRDRAGHADGPDRAGDAGRRAGVPRRRRADRHHDGADRPSRRAGAVRRRARRRST